MAVQRRWLLAIPAVIAAIAIVWIVARPSGKNAGRSLSLTAQSPSPAATAHTPSQSGRAAGAEVPDAPPAETAIAGAPVRAEARQPGVSAVPDSVDLSDWASEALAEPDPPPPLPPGSIPPDLVALPSGNLFIGYDDEGRRFLHFENSILNQSLMPLEVHGTLNPETNVTDVSQLIYSEDGAYIECPIGSFFYHPDHEHWHIQGIAEYQLWSVDSEGLIGEPVVQARKASYCLRDDARYPFDPHSESWPDDPVFAGCDTVIQGISPGWMDIYAADTPGQDIEITGLADGAYALVSQSNPDRVLYESDFTNNIAVTLIELVGDHVTLLGSTSNLPPPVSSS